MPIINGTITTTIITAVIHVAIAIIIIDTSQDFYKFSEMM